jgi:hypothetical protein
MQKRLLVTSALLLILTLFLASCGGNGDDNDDGDSGDNSNTTNQQTPVAEGTEISVLPPDSEISGFPQPRIIRASQNLTLLSYTVVQTENALYPMFLVRNDTGEMIEDVAALVVLLDEDDLRLTDYRLTSGFINIPPDQIVPLVGNYPIPIDYDGLATRIIRSGKVPFDGYISYFGAAVTAELQPDTALVQGTALNNSDKALVQPVAAFVLTDADGNLISVVAALVDGLDAEGKWQPGATLNLTGTVTAYSGDSLANVAQTQLIVVGYERTERTSQP